MKTNRWQDWFNLLLGAWLFASPWLMHYADELPNAAWNAHLLGAAIMLFSAVAMYVPRLWEEAVNILLGLWAVASPWVLGFASHRDVAENMVVIGGLVFLFAVWAIALDKDLRDRWPKGGRAA
ncbi:MAG TPA: SPW repeat protein [Noviherbaspirillum sp.]|uniref:SPW repeat protein n=1 Tax=Noviherbaspirillum sp. TaxID=1926288 RepID=UPI002D6CB10C|nr:SPW repeat protein [Noviherbaspirillum sp.]HYD96285.1 SPW repeat protein [Noviherbaspirillum sp.]